MVKIHKIVETICNEIFLDLQSLLLNRDLKQAETELQLLLKEVHEATMSKVLTEVGTSKEFKENLKEEYSSAGVGDLRQRENKIQLLTGGRIIYKSYYARKVDKEANMATRHLSELYWGLVGGASLGYAELVSVYSVMSPSFEVGTKLLGLHSISVNTSRLRELGIKMGELGHQVGVKGLLEEGESLKDKRVVISTDGGRSRMRESNGKQNQKGNARFDTPWREPKIIVIQVLTDQGELERKISIPFYYGTMKNWKKTMDKLREVLVLLDASQARAVQFISDGAKTIWKHIRGVIRSVGIPFSKVTFTLDYYHAVGHLKELTKLLEEEQTQQNVVFKQWKEMLWEGQASFIIRDFKRKIKNKGRTLTKEMKTALNYFKRHLDHMLYSRFKRRKLLCGSGLVESAVRRIINLRFKGTSSFWKKDNLEKLILLRCAFLAGRWNNLLNNIQLQLKNLSTI